MQSNGRHEQVTAYDLGKYIMGRRYALKCFSKSEKILWPLAIVLACSVSEESNGNALKQSFFFYYYYYFFICLWLISSHVSFNNLPVAYESY